MLHSRIVTIFAFDPWSDGRTVSVIALDVEDNDYILVTNLNMLASKASKLGYTVTEFMALTIDTRLLAKYEERKAGDLYENKEGIECTVKEDGLQLDIQSTFKLAPKEGFVVGSPTKKAPTQVDDTPEDIEETIKSAK